VSCNGELVILVLLLQSNIGVRLLSPKDPDLASVSTKIPPLSGIGQVKEKPKCMTLTTPQLPLISLLMGY